MICMVPGRENATWGTSFVNNTVYMQYVCGKLVIKGWFVKSAEIHVMMVIIDKINHLYRLQEILQPA